MSDQLSVEILSDGSIQSKVPARIGLLGNPSDGYGGRVLAFSISNFHATVKLQPSTKLQFLPNPESDSDSFLDIQSFQKHIKGHGFYGGVRVLKAVLYRFLRYAEENNISLGHFRNFTLSYSSNIPRQRGLSGSSAIACAALNCLISFFKLNETDLPVSHRPSLILAAEQDLGITAGLQDRIVQVYGGLIYMDFSDKMEYRSNDHSFKEQILSDVIGENTIGEDKKRKDSGKCSGDIHGNFKKRWNQQQNNELRVYMNEIADLAEKGKDILCRLASQCKNEVSEGTKVLKSKESKFESITQDEYKELGALIRRNFQLRRLLFGDNVLGDETLHMVSIADSIGAPAKLTGSGGAVLALCFNQNQASELNRACAEERIKCEKVILGAILHTFY